MPFSVCYKFKLHPRIDVYEINHIRTTEMKSNEEWSSQLWTQFMQFRKKPEKSSGPQQDLNPWPCNAVSMVFAKNAWDHDPILAQTHEKKKKKRLHLKSLVAEASKTKKKIVCQAWRPFYYHDNNSWLYHHFYHHHQSHQQHSHHCSLSKIPSLLTPYN